MTGDEKEKARLAVFGEASRDEGSEIRNWGGVVSVSLLLVQAAAIMAVAAAKRDAFGVRHELTILIRETAAIARFLVRREREGEADG